MPPCAVRIPPYTLPTLAGPAARHRGCSDTRLHARRSRELDTIYLVSLCTGDLDMAELIVEIRRYRQHHHRTSNQSCRAGTDTPPNRSHPLNRPVQ
ncbi:hypothetical protein A8144_08040 [Mycobacterium leprae 3125609]|nr:hypothetical protein A8144_08040 [Mycobacterium leprae 3125609]